MQRSIAGLCLSASLWLLPGAVHAKERDFCANRPWRGMPACTFAPGKALGELGGGAWDHSSDASSIEDEASLGDTPKRVGVTESMEVQLGLTGHVVQHTQDRLTGAVDRADGTCEASLAIRQSLSGPTGKVTLEVFSMLPFAKQPIGGGEWSGGMLLPADFEVWRGVEIDFTPELDVAANESGAGHSSLISRPTPGLPPTLPTVCWQWAWPGGSIETRGQWR